MSDDEYPLLTMDDVRRAEREKREARLGMLAFLALGLEPAPSDAPCVGCGRPAATQIPLLGHTHLRCAVRYQEAQDLHAAVLRARVTRGVAA